MTSELFSDLVKGSDPIVSRQLYDNTLLVIKGSEEGELLDYLQNYCPEIWQGLMGLKGEASILVDIEKGRIHLRRQGESPKEIDSHWLIDALKLINKFPKRLIDPRAKTVVVILGAGEGTRMRRPDKQKVIFPVGSRSAINRGIETYKRCGLKEQIVVVGVLGEQVVSEVYREHNDITFVCQAQQLGTGHAAKQALYLLEGQGYRGEVLVVAGDKVIDPEAIRKLLQEFREKEADLAFMVAPKSRWPSAGRVLFKGNGRVDRIVEKSDITRRILLRELLRKKEADETLSNQTMLEMVLKRVSDERKARKMLGEELWGRLKGSHPLSLAEMRGMITEDDLIFKLEEEDGTVVRLTPEELEARSPMVNISVYLFCAKAFYYALKRITRDNAQREEYLTDAVQILANARDEDGKYRYKVVPVEPEDPNQVLTFNSPEELREIEDYKRREVIEKLRRKGVIIKGDGANFWVDDVDSVDKIGQGTVLEAPVFIDLGPDPGMRIGRNCYVQGKVIRSSLGDNCIVKDAVLDRVVAGDGVTIESTSLSSRVIPSRVKIRGKVENEGRRVEKWIREFDDPGSRIFVRLREIYGEDPELIEERRLAYLRALKEYAKVYGSGEVIIVRAPGRVNLMGRHVDHRGGYVNPIAINREIIMVVGKREDDRVILHNTNTESFPPRSFSIGEELPPEKRGNWLDYIEKVELIPGDWANYVKAAVLRLQDRFYDRGLKGMNIIVEGNIPLSAGLSSSSALVVAAAEAALNLNGLELSPQEFVDLCAEGEWYVGTRGGSGDHAAMKYARRGFISHIGFFPFRIDFLPFPEDYRVLICDSFKRAHKSAGARSAFNEKVATYEIGMMMIKEKFKEYADKITYLRDVNPENLGVDVAEIYELLKALPERITRSDLKKLLPQKYHQRLKELFSTHDEPPQGYKVRQVCLFGLAECERSRICAEFLMRKDIQGFGELMNISHDGDRVVTFDEKGQEIGYDSSITDEMLDGLIEDLRSGDPERVSRAQLFRQPGGYECSTRETDYLVEIARQVEGVVGAQLSGAGLGGCVMVVVRKDRVGELMRAMGQRYYNTPERRLSEGVHICVPVEGSGVVG